MLLTSKGGRHLFFRRKTILVFFLFLTENRLPDLTSFTKNTNKGLKPAGFHSNKFIVTSAPVLRPVNVTAIDVDAGIEEEIIQPQQASSQKAELTKSVSLSQALPGNV